MPAAALYQTIKAVSPTISVGILAANLMDLDKDVALLEGTDVKLLHYDVMDGCFCPMMTVGPPFIRATKTSLLKDVHLMITEPLRKVADYVSAGADIVTLHVESDPIHIHRALQSLGEMTNANDPDRGIMRGVALNPGTPVEVVEPLLDEVDLVTVLAINPGWSGQKFIESTSERVAAVRQRVEERPILIAVDGGVTMANVRDVAAIGADIVVTGSAIFGGKTPKDNVKFVLECLRNNKQEPDR